MSDWWWYALIIVVVVAGAVFVYSRSRNTSPSGGGADEATRDYQGEREADRLGGMSAEDREWEAASVERNRQNQASREKPPTSDG